MLLPKVPGVLDTSFGKIGHVFPVVANHAQGPGPMADGETVWWQRRIHYSPARSLSTDRAWQDCIVCWKRPCPPMDRANESGGVARYVQIPPAPWQHTGHVFRVVREIPQDSVLRPPSAPCLEASHLRAALELGLG